MTRKRDHRRERQQEYLRAQGKAGYVPAAPVRERILFLHDEKGINYDVLSERTGLHKETLQQQARGVSKHGTTIRWCEKATEIAVMGARFTPADVSWPPSLATRRMLQGLYALGYTLPFLGSLVGVDYRNLHLVLSGRKAKHTVSAEFARTVREVYDKLSTTSPEDAGVNRQSASRARGFARSNGYAPPSCWDSDTIADPGAIPEWTGRCGTVYGWRIHETQGIPPCDACLNAQDSELGELSGDRLRDLRVRKGLSQEQLARAAGIKVDQYRSWECNRTRPRFPAQLESILTVLDVTYEEVCK